MSALREGGKGIGTGIGAGGEGDEEGDRRRELLEKIKDASNGPEHAKRRIDALDKMVMTLKTKRRECGESMEKDKEEMAWIDKEIKQIMSLYKPLVQRLNERLETQAKVAKNLKLAEQTMQTLKGETKGTAMSGLLSNAKLQRREASMQLRVHRGFGATPDTTFRQKRTPNVKGRLS